jgi:hypothetical protein
MTTVELAQHLVLVSRISDLARATPAQAQELALVMTRAVAEYFERAPVAHRRTTLSEYRLGVETVSVDAVNGSVQVGSSPFLARQRGCTIIFPDGSRNEIVGTNQLLKKVPSPTGTYNCQVYNDALAFDDFQIDRVCTDPEITTAGGVDYLLRPWATVGARTTHRVSLIDLLASGVNMPARPHEIASVPTHYWTEHVGGSIANSGDAAFQFRFWPAPTDPYHVTFDAEILPDTYRIGDVTSPSTVPVPDAHAQRILVPLARGLLARTPLFDPEKADKRDLLDDLGDARFACEGLAALFGPSHQTLATECGW